VGKEIIIEKPPSGGFLFDNMLIIDKVVLAP